MSSAIFSTTLPILNTMLYCPVAVPLLVTTAVIVTGSPSLIWLGVMVRLPTENRGVVFAGMANGVGVTCGIDGWFAFGVCTDGGTGVGCGGIGRGGATLGRIFGCG